MLELSMLANFGLVLDGEWAAKLLTVKFFLFGVFVCCLFVFNISGVLRWEDTRRKGKY